MKNSYIKVLKIVVITIICLGVFYVWYKDYSYLNWANIPARVVMPYEREAEIVDSAYNNTYSERKDEIVTQCWMSLGRFFVINISNNSQSEIYFTLYDYANYTKPSIITDLQILTPGETFSYESYQKMSYMLTLYGDANVEDISVEVSNNDYMKEYKKSVICTMIIISFLAVIQSVGCILLKNDRGIIIARIDLIVAIVLSVASTILYFEETIKEYYSNNLLVVSILLIVYGLVNLIERKMNKGESEKEEPQSRFAVAAICSICISFILFSRMLNSKKGSLLFFFSSSNHANMKAYIVILAIAFSTFLFLTGIRTKGAKLSPVFSTKYVFCRECVVYIFVLMYDCLYRFLCHTFGYVAITNKLGMTVCVLFVLVVLLLIISKRVWKVPNKISQICLWSCYSISIILVVLKTSYINIWNMDWNELFHCDFIFRPLYYVANDLPLDGPNVHVYGQSAILYKPIMEVFGSSTLVCGIITGLVGGIMISCAITIVHMLTKSNLIRIMSTITFVNAVMINYSYPMTIPIRMVFPMIILLIIWKLIKSGRPISLSSRILGYLICIGSIFWNRESGIVCSLTWAVFMAISNTRGKENNLWETVKKFLCEITIIAVEIFLAYVCIKVYDVYAFIKQGRSNIFDAFQYFGEFGGIISKEYMTADQMLPLYWNNSLWIYILALYIFMAFWGMSKIGLIGKNEENQYSVGYIACSVAGIGLFTLYISRPEDFLCAYYPVILCTSILTSNVIKRIRFPHKMSFCEVLYVFILFGCLMVFSNSIINLPMSIQHLYNSTVEKEQLNYGNVETVVQEFENKVPENTYSDADGILLLYMNAGRKMPTQEEADYYLSFALSMPGYRRVSQFNLGELEYYLYIKN